MAVRVLWETETQRMEACDHEGTSETEGNLSKCTECGKVWPSSFKGSRDIASSISRTRTPKQPDVETDQESDGSASSVVQYHPVFFREGIELYGFHVGVLPWRAPSLSAADGKSPESGEPLVVLSYEWPIPWLRSREPLPKTELEQLHLLRFETDARLTLGRPLFGAARPGGNPPDLVLTTDQGEIGLDCTAFTVEGRREAHALFMNLRRRIVELGPNPFARLSGHTVYIWFNDQQSIGKPFRHFDENAIRDLLEQLAKHEPNPADYTVEGNELPGQLQTSGLMQTESGAVFYALPFLGSVPDTDSFAVMGFELGLAYTTEHTPSSAWAEIERLVSKHDQPNVEVLLISAGAPNAHGFCFGAEEIVAQLAIDNAQALPDPQYVKHVLMHLWSTGEAHELLPIPTKIFGPAYEGLTTAHRPIAPQERSPAPAETETLLRVILEPRQLRACRSRLALSSSGALSNERLKASAAAVDDTLGHSLAVNRPGSLTEWPRSPPKRGHSPFQGEARPLRVSLHAVWRQVTAAPSPKRGPVTKSEPKKRAPSQR